MTAFAKIKAGRVNSLDFHLFVGEEGHLFYDVTTGEIRLSDGHTPGGLPIAITASTINTASFLPDLDDTYGLGDPTHRWNHIHVGSGGIYMDGAEGSQGYTLDVNTSTHTLEYIGGTGNIAVGGITFPDTSRQTVAFEPTAIPQSIIPKTTDIYDLGSYSHRWANVYIGPHSLHIVDQQTLQDISITVDNGTLLLSGVENLAVGNLVIRNTTLETVTPDLNIYVGGANDTGDAVIGRQLYVNNYNYPSDQALLTLNASNQTAPVNQFPYTIVETVSRQDYNSRIIQRSYGTTSGLGVEGVYSVFGGYSARGTATAPGQTKSGDIILRMSGQGYAANVGFTSTGGARIDFKATQDFTDRAKGTRIDFWTTPVNSNVVTNSASINNTGFVGNAFTFNTDGSTQTVAGIPYTAKGNPNASLVATLGIDGRLDTSQIPTSLTGAVVFKGGWDAGNNNPVLSDGSGITGWEYIVTTGGTANLGTSSVTYAPGDYVVYGGNVWLYVQGVSPFTSLTGGQHITISSPTGAMTLGSDATPNYTTGTIVSRDGSGNFSANQITANLLGIATSALTAGTVTNPVQTAITTVGNLGNLTVLGNISATNYIGSGQYLTGVGKPGDISGANAAIQSLTNSIAGANAAISTNANNISGANAAISGLTNSIAGANAAITGLSNSITGANATISQHTNSIANINANIAGANAAISTITNNLAGANATISGLTNSLAGANAAISTNANNISGANATIANHTNSIAGANAAISTNANNITGANATISGLTNSLAGANAAISTNANNITGANAAILVLQGQVYANANVATYLPSYNGNIRAAYITVTNTSTLGNITITGSNIYSTATNVDLNLGQLTATANLNINRTTVHNKDVTVNGNVSLAANTKLTLPKMVYNDGGVRTIAGGTPTVTLDFSSDSIVTIWQPTGTVTLQYGTLVAGSSVTVLINLATKRAIVLGVSGTNNSSTASTSLQNGAGTPNLVNNQLVSLVYTCTDGTAANTYVSCSYA